MGHEFGADHCFNECDNANENQPTAYEPGSGSTIMCYAGVCGGNNNLQNHSDAYFHAVSQMQITNYITNSFGANCPLLDSVTIEPPAQPAILDSFNIPRNTPFELTAPQATTTSDTLLYCWEQWNLGDYRQAESGAANFTHGPSFRSFNPDTSRTRVFPKLQSIINNINDYTGERLSNVARSLTFKLTTRSVENGWGTFNFSDDSLIVNVVNTDTPFLVTAPNTTNLTWQKGSTQTVTWLVAQTDIAPINCSNVDIFLSVDGGHTYPYALATGVPNNGAAQITLPDLTTTQARIKVKGTGNIFFDISNYDFTIKDTTTSVQNVALNKAINIAPNPASNFVIVTHSGNQQLNLLLYDATGRKLWTGQMDKQKNITLNNYAKGLYFLHISDAKTGATTVKKIAVE
jgi:hypothetical protein